MPPRQEPFENDIQGDDFLPVAVVTDPYSTACLVVKEIESRGYGTIAIWSKGAAEELKEHVPKLAGKMNYIAEIDEGDSIRETADRLKHACKERPLEALFPGGESGVDLADALSEFLGLPSNGTDIPNRRDKKVQQDMVRKKGLRAIREACGSSFCDVEDFLKREPYPLVLKPLDSAGSDGVKVVNSFEEAKVHFKSLIGKPMVNGPICEAVLCQERLVGTEYVVDSVSCNGYHKIMMIWKYDKRAIPQHGADFCYFGGIPVDVTTKEGQMLAKYMEGVLEAIGMKYGACHGEVIITENPYEPCLVEVNCRTNGGDGCWVELARALTGGYSQVDATANAYLDEEKFHRLPDRPPAPLKASGEEVMLVSYANGKIKSTPGFEEIKKMQSFLQMEPTVGVGSDVAKTIDLATGCGSVILLHDDSSVFQRDRDRIRELENTNQMFEFED